MFQRDRGKMPLQIKVKFNGLAFSSSHSRFLFFTFNCSTFKKPLPPDSSCEMRAIIKVKLLTLHPPPLPMHVCLIAQGIDTDTISWTLSNQKKKQRVVWVCEHECYPDEKFYKEKIAKLQLEPEPRAWHSKRASWGKTPALVSKYQGFKPRQLPLP